MSTDAAPSRRFDQLLEEHQQLQKILSQVGTMLATRSEASSRVAEKITALCDSVASHFAHEEEGGYMSGAIAAAPHFGPWAKKLEAQHPQLLGRLKQLKTLGEQRIRSSGWWEQLETEFGEFASQFLEHEQAENCLLQEAFGRDLGATD